MNLDFYVLENYGISIDKMYHLGSIVANKNIALLDDLLDSIYLYEEQVVTTKNTDDVLTILNKDYPSIWGRLEILNNIINSLYFNKKFGSIFEISVNNPYSKARYRLHVYVEDMRELRDFVYTLNWENL